MKYEHYDYDDDDALRRRTTRHPQSVGLLKTMNYNHNDSDDDDALANINN